MTPDRAHNAPSRNLNEMLHTSISEAFYNKKNLTKRDAAFTTSFSASIVTEPQLIQHITRGGAFAPAIFDGNRKRANFVSSQIIALDLDNGVSVRDALTSDDIAAYAVFVGATVSSTPEHPRSRVLFVLDRPVTNADEYEALVRGALHHFAALEPDAACKDAARFYYGAERDEYVYQPGRALSVDLVRSWIPVKKAPTRTPLPATATRYATVALEAEVNAMSAAIEGRRYTTLRSSSFRVFSLVKAGALDKGAAHMALKHAASTTGLPEREIDRLLSWTWSEATARQTAINTITTTRQTPANAARERSIALKRHDVRLWDMLHLCGVTPGERLTTRHVQGILREHGLHPSASTIQTALSLPIFEGGLMPTADGVNDAYEVPANLWAFSYQLDLDTCRTMTAYRLMMQLSIYASTSRKDTDKSPTHKRIAQWLGVAVSTVRLGMEKLERLNMLGVTRQRRVYYAVEPAQNGADGWQVQRLEDGVKVSKNAVWRYVRQRANRYRVLVKLGVTQIGTLLSSLTQFQTTPPESTATQPTTTPPQAPVTVETLRTATKKFRRWKYAVLPKKKRQQKSINQNLHGSKTSSRAPAMGAMSSKCKPVLESFAAEFDAVITPLGGSA
jgi:hypothetical protein